LPLLKFQPSYLFVVVEILSLHHEDQQKFHVINEVLTSPLSE